MSMQPETGRRHLRPSPHQAGAATGRTTTPIPAARRIAASRRQDDPCCGKSSNYVKTSDSERGFDCRRRVIRCQADTMGSWYECAPD
jgi:hypothetical protein